MNTAKSILGMNARELIYSTVNSAQAKSYCTSKFATKVLLHNKNIATAEVYGVFALNEDVVEFDWENRLENFVIKPTNGHAGKGIVAFRKKVLNEDVWTDTLGNKWTLEDIKMHCYDILEGQYSTHGTRHNVIVEERIPIHPKLLKYSYKGTPDIRVIVFNQVPVMAMLRLPTKESEGRANLSQGAIGVGIDMASGITTHAIAHKTQIIKYLPDTKKKLNGIKIPSWNSVLNVAVEASMAAGLTYCGVDLFIHKEKGPMVVELNAYPGLAIQLANQAGLRKRLQRVEDLHVLNSSHGVRIGQALFAESFADKIKANDGLTIIEPKEEIIIIDGKNQKKVASLVNTGRYRSAISSNLAGELGLIDLDDLLWFQTEKEEGKVAVVEIKFKIREKIIKTAMIVSKKLNKSSHKIEIGRKDLAGFLVGVES